MKSIAVFVCVLLVLISACSPTPTATPLPPTPDARATETRIALNIFATQTASAPTLTPVPSATNTIVTTPTSTVKQTATRTRVAVTATPVPAFIFQWNSPHYECQTKPWTQNDGTQVSGKRSFQLTIVVKNVGKDTLLAPWKPTRWTITNGKASRIDTSMWQWVARGGQFYQQPTLSPSVQSEWTFLAFPLQQDEWVDHLEWDLFGQTYKSTSFNPGEFKNNYNYKVCP